MVFIKQLNYWYRKYLPKPVQNIIKQNMPEFIEFYFLSKKAKKNEDFSGHGEAKEISKYVDKLIENEKYFVDIGASDGVNSSSTLMFAKKEEWRGLSIEFDRNKFSKLSYVYKKFKNIDLLNEKITPNNIDTILKNSNVPNKFTLLNLDIDSYDLSVLTTLLNKNYRPKIISMEINEKFPPPIYFNVLFDSDHFWKGDHFFGCSLSAAYTNLNKYGYILAKLQFNNAIFLDPAFFLDEKSKSPENAYNEGYRNKSEREKIFSYNKDVDCLLSMNPEDSIKFINEMFIDYKDKYELKI